MAGTYVTLSCTCEHSAVVSLCMRFCSVLYDCQWCLTIVERADKLSYALAPSLKIQGMCMNIKTRARTAANATAAASIIPVCAIVSSGLHIAVFAISGGNTMNAEISSHCVCEQLVHVHVHVMCIQVANRADTAGRATIALLFIAGSETAMLKDTDTTATDLLHGNLNRKA
jgi:hypothetical protein